MTKNLLFIASFFFQLILIGQTSAGDNRQIISAQATTDGRIEWTSSGETTNSPYVIEQFRWQKWIKIGEIDPHASPQQKTYQFKAVPYNGENLCRIKPTDISTEGKEVKWINSEMPKVKFKVNKKTNKIEFMDSQSSPTETMYEIYDSSGGVVKKGWGQSISIENFSKGKYILNYDNTTGKFKR